MIDSTRGAELARAEAVGPAALPFFYGWVSVALAALAMVGTLPGRTQGLGLITEPLIADLQLDRVLFARVNLWATLIGALFALGVGRVIDRFGSRVVLAVVAALLGAVVLWMSAAHGLLALAVAVTLTRGLGQSALSVVSITMVGQWFVRRLGAAMAVYTVALSVGFMIAFPVVGAVVGGYGWRAAWAGIGAALLLALAPLAWLLARRSPESCGLRPDGTRRGEDDAQSVDEGDAEGTPFVGAREKRDAEVIDARGVGQTTEARDVRAVGSGDVRASAQEGHTLWQAVATPAFWVFGLASAVYGLTASGIGLFNESILAERGFDASTYYNTLAVTALTALAGNFLGGWLIEKWTMSRLMALAMGLLAGSLVALPHVSTQAHVMAYAVVMGLAGGFVIVIFFTFWSRAYGRAHLGQIQGAAQALTVLASAVGPLLLAECVTRTGSYAAMFYVLTVVVAALGLCAWFVRVPRRGAEYGVTTR